MEEDQGADRQLTKQGLSQILQESTRMHQMVLQLLEMSDKSIYMEKRPVNLAALARNVAQALEIKAARYEMGIETSLPEELWTYGVEDRLRQVLINLVDNAIKYGDSRASIRISGMERNGFVWLFVRNRGKGLAPRNRSGSSSPSTGWTRPTPGNRAAPALGFPSAGKSLRNTRASSA